MQHTNDDIDDLLRNAAESYPLKITGANWGGIAGRLSGEEGDGESEPAVVVPFTDTSKRYRKYLLAMLLIPVGLILAKYAGLIGSGNEGGQQLAQPQQTVKIEPKASETKPGTGNNVGLNKAAVVEPSGSNIGATAQKAAVITDKADNATSKILTNKKGAQFSMKVTNAGVAIGNVAGENKSQSNVPHLGDLPALQQKQEIAAANGNNNGNVAASAHPEIPTTEDVDGAAPKVKESVAATEPVATQAQPQGKTPTPLVHHNTRKGRFYIGAFVAPDYTTVKYQPGSKVGFNSGGVVGYTFMKNLSVEVGIAAGRKYYESSGKYFNSTESWLNSWGKVLNISGYASLTEFPINFKYDFKRSKDGNFFATAGVVSYIVHQENYNYVLDKNGVIYSRDKSPIVATNSLFANASVSAGYESSLGGLCNFRIEPYYRIPIKGIGIGGLPITSIGLNIGITKKFK